MKFTVEGTIDLGREMRKFTKTVEAVNEKTAKDKVFSLLGSSHGKNRDRITISAVKKEA